MQGWQRIDSSKAVYIFASKILIDFIFIFQARAYPATDVEL